MLVLVWLWVVVLSVVVLVSYVVWLAVSSVVVALVCGVGCVVGVVVAVGGVGVGGGVVSGGVDGVVGNAMHCLLVSSSPSSPSILLTSVLALALASAFNLLNSGVITYVASSTFISSHYWLINYSLKKKT